MRRSRTILRNTLSNIGLQTITFATTFVLLPLVVGHFGKEIYGIYVYVGSMVLLLTFLSSAISTSLTKYIPEFMSRSMYREVNEIICTLVPFCFFVHLCLGLAVFSFPYYGLEWFSVSPELHVLTRQVMQVVGIFIMLHFLAPIVTGILTGLELFHLRNVVSLISIAASILGYVYVRVTDGSLTEYVLILQVGATLVLLVSLGCAFKKIPIKLTWVRPRTWVLGRLWRFNAYLIASQVSDHLMYTMDKLILQKVLGPVSVTDYHVARRSQEVSNTFISLPLGAIIPSLSVAFAGNDMAYVKKMNTSGAFVYSLLVVPPLITWVVLFDKFMNLWFGPGFAPSIVGGVLFLLTVIVATPFKVFAHSLVAKGRVKELGVSRISYAVVNVVLSIIFVRHLGMIGVIIPTVFYWLAVYPAVLIYLLADEDFIATARALRGMAPTILVLLLQSALYVAVYRNIGVPRWSGFVVMFPTVYIVSVMFYLAAAALLNRESVSEAFREVLRLRPFFRGV